MPTNLQNEFLYPTRAGEQVPPSQIMTQGPFSAELTQPAYRRVPMPVTGQEGPGTGILHFVNNFLAGASEARLRRFQQSEITKKEHERNYDAVVQHVLDSPRYTQDFKETVLQQALQTKAGAGLAAMGGSKGGKNDHPLLGMARNLFSGIVGPSENAKHVDIGPEHVSDLVSQMHAPENQFNLAEEVQKATGQINQIIKQRQEAAQRANMPMGETQIPGILGTITAPTTAPAQPVVYDQQHAMADPEIQQALTNMRRQGYEPMQFYSVQSAFGQLPPRLSAADQKTLATRAKQLEAAEAQLEHYRAGNMKTFQQPGGEPFTAFVRGGKLYYPGGEEVPGDKLKGIRELEGQTYTQSEHVVTDEYGRTYTVPYTTYHGKGAPPSAVPPTQPPPQVGGPQATPQGTGGPAPATGSIPDQVMQAFDERGIDPKIGWAMAKAESNFDPNAISRDKDGNPIARGVMQLVPSTAADHGVTDPHNPQQNIPAGAEFFTKLYSKYEGDLDKTLAAYNWGPANVDSGKDYPRETKDYIERVHKFMAQAPAFGAVGAQAGAGTTPATATGAPTPPAAKAPGSKELPPLPPGAKLIGQKTPVRPPEEEMRAAMEEAAQSLAKGDLTRLKDLIGLRSDQRILLFRRVRQLNPNYDTAKVDRMIKMEDSFANGKDRQNLQSFGTFFEHAGEAREAADAIYNTDVALFNKPINWWRKNMSGDPNFQAFMTSLEPVRKEFEGFLLGGRALYGEDRKAAATILDENSAPSQINAALKQMGKAATARFTEMNHRYKRTMGKDIEEPFSQEAIAGAKTVGIDLPRSGTAATQAPPLNPNPNGYTVGHVYGGLTYRGGDPNKRESWGQ